jgi:catechol 2,3-dioxygenase-like lactoylglutathione lyase family enzyme
VLHGSINHVALTVSNLKDAMTFFRPLLELLGYRVGLDGDGEQLVVSISPATGGAINIWQAQEPHAQQPFEVYAPGLHHLAINVAGRAQVDEVAALIPNIGGRVTDPPAEYPFTSVGTYYAVYFRGPDNLKLEVVHMSELERLHAERGTLGDTLWKAPGG